MSSRLIASLWFGAGAFLLFVAAPAAFTASPNPTMAANVVGAMLMRWHYIALIAPVILLVLGWKTSRTIITSILFAAILFAATQSVVDTKIRSIRMSSPVAMSELPRTDPVRKRFGLLHGVSSILLLAQILCAGTVVAIGHRD
jgi:hypothetical protein